jgi:hypothetical protein
LIACQRATQVGFAQFIHKLPPEFGPTFVEHLGARSKLIGDGQMADSPRRPLPCLLAWKTTGGDVSVDAVEMAIALMRAN